MSAGTDLDRLSASSCWNNSVRLETNCKNTSKKMLLMALLLIQSNPSSYRHSCYVRAFPNPQFTIATAPEPASTAGKAPASTITGAPAKTTEKKKAANKTNTAPNSADV